MAKKYFVELYDKDNDVITPILYTDNFKTARSVCRAIHQTLLKTFVLNRDNRTTPPSSNVQWGLQLPYEMYDWVQIYSPIQKKVIYVNDHPYKEI